MLTEEQLAAVKSDSQETVVVAGAGAGKTRVLVERVKEMLARGHAPESIVVFTFTRKAANEIRERLGEAGNGVRCGTFHSICLELISEQEDVTPIDDDMADRLIAEVCKTQNRKISRKMIDGCRVARCFGKPGGNVDIQKATDMYEGRLLHDKAIDYLGMLTRGLAVAKLLESHHVIVDEAQDTDDLQWAIVDALKKSGSGFYVGDSAQSIYAFRGVKAERLLERDGLILPLNKTFRFGKDLADLTNEVSQFTGTGKKAIVSAIDTETRIRRVLMTDVVGMLIAAATPSQFAILCRYNDQVDSWVMTLEAYGIPVAKQKSIDHAGTLAILRYLADHIRRSRTLGSLRTRLLARQFQHWQAIRCQLKAVECSHKAG